MKKEKVYKVIMHRDGYVSGKMPIETEGTLKELTEYYSYTLENGKSWENEKGNSKISVSPKSINALISNVNKAMNNSAGNGHSGKWLELVEEEKTD